MARSSGASPSSKGVEPDRITASLVNGVLSLIVPKLGWMTPKAITIGTGRAQAVWLDAVGDFDPRRVRPSDFSPGCVE